MANISAAKEEWRPGEVNKAPGLKSRTHTRRRGNMPKEKYVWEEAEEHAEKMYPTVNKRKGQTHNWDWNKGEAVPPKDTPMSQRLKGKRGAEELTKIDED